MTVSSTTSRVTYAGNGVTVTFTVPFYFLAAADLTVIRTASNGTQTTLVLNTDYTVSGAGVPAGGSITCTTAPGASDTLVIFRDPAATQLTDYQPNDPFPAETHERALDKLTMLAQRLRGLIDRSFRLSDGDTSQASTVLPSPSANRLIGWNSGATALQNVPVSDLATAVAYGTTRYDTFTGTGAQTQFTLSEDPASIGNLDVSVGGVVQVPGVDYDLTNGVLVFTSAPPNGVTILARYGRALPVSGPVDASAVSFLQAGAGAVTRTVQAKLRESQLSVKDYGAVGDGVANDTNAINAAIAAAAAGQTIYFPPGTYLVGSPSSSLPISAIPVGVNVFMEKSAWLKGQGTWLTNFLSPLGHNILTVNIDGNSLPAGGVKGTWNQAAGSAVAISGTTATGFANNVENVIICNSEIKNLQYGVLTDGAKNWRVYGNYFHELRNSAIQIGAQSGRESYRCIANGNVFDNLGDYAVSFYSTNGVTPGDNAYHIVANNTAKNCQQRTNGYAYGVEAGNPTFQHHFVFANNSYECTSVGLSGGNGGITISTTSDSMVVGNNLVGNVSDISNAVGVNAIGFGGEVAQRGLIAGNHIEKFSTSGINLGGHNDCLVSGNHVVDCGYTSSGFGAIRIRDLSTSNVAIVGNYLRVNSTYPHYGAGTPAIGCVAGAGATVSNITIKDNVIVNPNDYGIFITGSAAIPASNCSVIGNQILGTQDATFFKRESIYADYCNRLEVSNNVIVNATRGIRLDNINTATVGENVLKGTVTLSWLWLFSTATPSTNMLLRNNECTAPLTAVFAPASGSSTQLTTPANNNRAVGGSGLVVERKGLTGLIASGATVAHGLSVTPTNVVITPADAGVTDFFVSALGSTTFTINYGGGGTHAFYWRAEF